MQRVIHLLLLLLPAGFLCPVEADDFSGWMYSMRIVFDVPSNKDENPVELTDFPILVRLDSGTFNFSQARPGGTDIRFSDERGAPLAHQLDEWDGARKRAALWVRFPKLTLPLAEGTQVSMILHWGNNLPSLAQDGAAVFDTSTGFSGVWHLQESALEARMDAASHRYHASPFQYDGDEKINGIIGRGDSLDGVTRGEYLDLPDGFANFTAGLTFSFWVWPSEAKNYSTFIDLGNGVGQDNILFHRKAATEDVIFRTFVGTQDEGGLTAGNALISGQWQHLAVTQESNGQMRMYRNGVPIASGSGKLPRNVVRTANFIGRSNWGNSFFQGKLDEIRISKQARTADWIRLSYENQKPDSRLLIFSEPRKRPLITANPEHVTVYPGDTASFAITATGTGPLSYLWHKNGFPLAEKGNIMNFPATLADNGSIFHCIVSNEAGTATSLKALLTVQVKPSMGIVTKPLATPTDSLFTDSVLVAIRTSTLGAQIFYTTDGSLPDSFSSVYKVPLSFYNSVHFQAIAMKPGMLPSPVLRVHYVRRLSPPLLQGGDSLSLPGGFVLLSPTGSPAIQIDTMLSHLLSVPGMADARMLFELKEGENLPTLGLRTHPAMGAVPPIYRLTTKGDVFHLPIQGGIASLSEAGTYFHATDTSPPEIKILSERVMSNDSVEVRFFVHDNVQNLLLSLGRGDDPNLDLRGQKLVSGQIRVLLFKNKPGTLAPLWFHMDVSDHTQQSFYPPQKGSRYVLSQPVREMQSPFPLPGRRAWGLMGAPLRFAGGLTLGALSQSNGMRLRCALWQTHPGDSVGGYYRFLSAKDTLPQGVGIWLLSEDGSGFPAPLRWPHGATQASGKDGSYQIQLRRGWNQIASPGLDTLFWPVPRDDKLGYPLSSVKGLLEYDAEADAFLPSRFMEPWRGYFVYFHGLGDTIITLRRQDTSNLSASALTKSNWRPSISFSLRDGRRGLLRLGAYSFARSGIGREDEFMAPGQTGPRVWAERQSHILQTDFIEYRQGGRHTWQILCSQGPEPVRVEEMSLPPGYEIWAFSKGRKVTWRLKPGEILEFLPGGRDTLHFHAAPAGEFIGRGGSADFADPPSELAMGMGSGRNSAQGRQVYLNLPWKARVVLQGWASNGKALAGKREMNLPQGYYTWDVPGRLILKDAGLLTSNPSREFSLVTLRVQGLEGQYLKSFQVFKLPPE